MMRQFAPGRKRGSLTVWDEEWARNGPLSPARSALAGQNSRAG